MADYLRMPTLEPSGQACNKTAHRRVLPTKLDGRSEASIEQKHRSISAVMEELGFPPIEGYKRLDNYQHFPIEVIEQQAAGNELLDRAALAAVEQPAVMPLLNDANLVLVPAPLPSIYMKLLRAMRRGSMRCSGIAWRANHAIVP